MKISIRSLTILNWNNLEAKCYTTIPKWIGKMGYREEAKIIPQNYKPTETTQRNEEKTVLRTKKTKHCNEM